MSEFPFVQQLKPRQRSKVESAWDTLRRLQAANLEAGGLLPVMVAAKALNLSRTRIDELMADGRLERIEVEGHVFIGGRSVAEFAWKDRRNGRPKLHGGASLVLDIVRGVASEKV